MTDQQQPFHSYDPTTGLPVIAQMTAAERPDYVSVVDPSRPCNQTAGDLFMSLNGFDEMAVTIRFGATLSELRSDAVTLGRALAFVHMRRQAQGQPGADESAYQGAMSLTIQTVSHEYFQPEPVAEPKHASAEGNAPGEAA